MKNNTLGIFIFLLFYGLSSFKIEPKIGEKLSSQFHNNFYREFDAAIFDTVFEHTLSNLGSRLKNPSAIASYYFKNGHKPTLTLSFVSNGEIDSLINYLNLSMVHGFRPSVFNVSEIQHLYHRLKSGE